MGDNRRSVGYGVIRKQSPIADLFVDVAAACGHELMMPGMGISQ